MKRYGLLAFLTLSIVSCSDPRPVELANGYQLWAMNPRELYVSKPDHELIVGPGLQRIAVHNNYILAYCADENQTSNGFANTKGYSIIDTLTGQVLDGLNQQEFESRLAGLKIPDSPLEDVSKFF
jgi:hypothetical protein